MWLSAASTVLTLCASGMWWGQTQGAAGVAAGIATWGFAWPSLEYTLHRSLHLDHSSRHMRHHRDTDDASLYFVPTAWLAPRVLGYLFACWLMFSHAYALGVSGGFALCYTLYEVGHTWTHLRGHARSNTRIDRMTAWHARHHDAWGVNFGVSTPFWDIVQGTASAKTVADMDMGWLAWLLLPLPWVSMALPRASLGLAWRRHSPRSPLSTTSDGDVFDDPDHIAP